jgi:RNA polymerase sigma factor (sigma-70 family)
MEDEKCLVVDDYLEQLAGEDPVKAEVVKLRIFTGLKVSEIATVLGCSEKTVQRHWNFARAWLSRLLKSTP